MPESTISVVIPTMGRPALAAALDSVERQYLKPDEIVLVNDSPEQHSLERYLAHLSIPVQELFTGGRTGEPAARNVGFRAVSGRYVALLDDDDVWLPHHLDRALGYLRRHPEIDIYSASALMATPGGLRPTTRARYRDGARIFDHMYGVRAAVGRRRAIPPSTWVFRQRCLEIEMDENVPRHVDVWWLNAQEAAGRRLHQDRSVEVIYFGGDPDRMLARHDLDSLKSWANRIEGVRKGAGAGFLFGQVGRHYARAGRPEALKQLSQALSPALTMSVGVRAVRLAERVVARGMSLAKRRAA